MPAPTAGYVKNMIRRSFRELVDPSPTRKEVQAIWQFFCSQCAYCGKEINKARKEGHIDHLVSSARGGSNNVSNRVLSCATCNEKEKLDMPWEDFLAQKSHDTIAASRRKKRILKWRSKHKMTMPKKEVLLGVDSLSKEVIKLYDEKVQQARQLRNL